jgi:hypothetical protein
MAQVVEYLPAVRASLNPSTTKEKEQFLEDYVGEFYITILDHRRPL